VVLSASLLSDEIAKGNECHEDGIAIVPSPDLLALKNGGEASVNLRLGRWFLTLRASSETHLDTSYVEGSNETKYSKKYFVPFGEKFVLHPGRFVLASTLEWIKVPRKYAAFVVGKSSLGRRGVVIETAAGVHPGFCGCLTLEIANVGEIPVRLEAGMMICQLFFHSIEGEGGLSNSGFSGQRKPRLGQVKEDKVLINLRDTRR
jgi:dCTP deaminase